MLWYIFVFPFTIFWDLMLLCVVLGFWYLVFRGIFDIIQSICTTSSTTSVPVEEAPTEEMGQIRFI